MRSETHCCPRCTGAVNCEDYAEHEVRASDGTVERTDRFLHCLFCGLGLETSTYPDGAVYALHYYRADGWLFDGFVQRLEAARVA
ncbi:MAG: hypothetical protein IID41_14495 [Planctomycetes bacterium]|nr:hypothetical protein [Planctomycetota bacterium]